MFLLKVIFIVSTYLYVCPHFRASVGLGVLLLLLGHYTLHITRHNESNCEPASRHAHHIHSCIWKDIWSK